VSRSFFYAAFGGFIDPMTARRLLRSWGAFALAWLLLAVPLLAVHAPGMPDYPAHLAGFYLMGGGLKDTLLAQFYRMDWALPPNLASELLVGVPAAIMDPVFLSRLYLILTLGLWVLGPVLIHRALYGRAGIAPLFAALFAYNANFFWGFMNFDFCAGAALVLFAWWLKARDAMRLRTLAALTLAASALYVGHLFAFATFALLIFADEAGRILAARAMSWRALPRFLPPLLICMPAALLYLFARPDAGVTSDMPVHFFLDWPLRFGAALHTTLESADWVSLGLLFGAAGFGMLSGVVRLNRRMILPLLVIACALMLMPDAALGGWGLELRLPPIFGALFFAAAEVNLRARQRVRLAGFALALIALHAIILALDWQVYDRQYAEFRLASKEIPRGARLMTVIDGDAIGNVPEQPYSHMAEFSIIDRAAFTPLLFTTKGQHIIRVQRDFAPYAAATAMQGSPPDLSELPRLANAEGLADPTLKRAFPYLIDYPCHFDKIVLIQGNGPKGALPAGLKLARQGSFFSIYDIEQPARCKT
jgi:hypothetical protein